MNNTDPPPLDDDWQDRCGQYLLGELTPSQRCDFERELAGSAELARRLLRESDLILALAQAPARQCAEVTRSATRSWRRPLGLVLAIAACLTLIWIGARPAVTGPPEELLIARAWTRSLATEQWTGDQWHSEQWPSEPALADTEDPIDGDLLDHDLVDGDQSDATLHWMFVAVASQMDSAASGDLQ